MSAAQHKISADIDQIRASIPHAGETGDLVERVFRDQLHAVLPEKVGISNGFVLDANGNVSKQMDIILYDRLNTPRIFTSNGAQVFPVESTYACGEIKTSMDSTQLVDTFDKCLSYKKLIRRAYFSNSHRTQTNTCKLFGSEYEHWQSIFFCIAARSVSAGNLLSTFKEIAEGRSLQVHERVDTLVALHASDNQNMLLNCALDVGTSIPRDKSIDFLPYPGSSICTYPATEPWSLFVMLLLRYMVQAPTEPVNMIHYGGSDPF